ncbi:MAG: DUF5398 domain-containing protein [Rhabdochlamydiaceae bacterium]|nr:DUF5398 domain-containing protein [Rhabdochlamydiaceae bacterium]
MFGLEKKGKELFEFDLEKQFKDTPTKLRDTQKHVEEKTTAVKALLRQGANSSEFDQLGVLLHGYAALQKVLTRIAKKK